MTLKFAKCGLDLISISRVTSHWNEWPHFIWPTLYHILINGSKSVWVEKVKLSPSVVHVGGRSNCVIPWQRVPYLSASMMMLSTCCWGIKCHSLFTVNFFLIFNLFVKRLRAVQTRLNGSTEGHKEHCIGIIRWQYQSYNDKGDGQSERFRPFYKV